MTLGHLSTQKSKEVSSSSMLYAVKFLHTTFSNFKAIDKILFKNVFGAYCHIWIFTCMAGCFGANSVLIQPSLILQYLGQSRCFIELPFFKSTKSSSSSSLDGKLRSDNNLSGNKQLLMTFCDSHWCVAPDVTFNADLRFYLQKKSVKNGYIVWCY